MRYLDRIMLTHYLKAWKLGDNEITRWKTRVLNERYVVLL